MISCKSEEFFGHTIVKNNPLLLRSDGEDSVECFRYYNVWISIPLYSFSYSGTNVFQGSAFHNIFPGRFLYNIILNMTPCMAFGPLEYACGLMWRINHAKLFALTLF